MAAGKRLNTSEPLTEHDVADRLDRAALRVVRIMMDTRQLGMMEQVKHSRYLTGVLNMLAAELKLWDVEPVKNWDDNEPPSSLPLHAGQCFSDSSTGRPLISAT